MYQERQVNENALRVSRSLVMRVTIISAISYGRGRVGSCLVRVHGNALPRRRLAARCQMATMRVERFAPAVRTVHRSELFVYSGGRNVLDIGDADSLERPTSPDARDVVIVVKCFE